MDAMSELLADVRARGAIFRETAVRSPWAVRVPAGAPLTLAVMVRGTAWIAPDQHEPRRLGVGDIALVRGDTPYTVGDAPSTPPSLVVTEADYCTPTRGAGNSDAVGSRRCGAPEDRSPVLLSGAFERRGDVSERLLQALPAVLVVAADPVATPSAETVAAEIGRARPGQQLVLDRLLDLMLVSTLRSWFADPDSGAPAWCRALDDPIVGTALTLLHDSPAHPWTVADLAAEVGLSRAAFARRFASQVGEPPMAYLTSWRIATAADLLWKSDSTVDTIARKVGYANAFALSVAFTRLRGMRPSEHRATTRRRSASRPGPSASADPRALGGGKPQ